MCKFKVPLYSGKEKYMKKIIFNNKSLEVKHLAENDCRLAEIIDYFDSCELNIREDYFKSLVKSIIGQQLSVKAAFTISTRLINICEIISPETILSIDNNKFRKIGISRAKILYIKSLAEKIISKEIDLEKINQYSDDEVIEYLIKVKGIGKWTAEMFLIFSLGRLDIFSVNDAGLKRALKWLYDIDRDVELDFLISRTNRWSPYRTIASLYLWKIIDEDLINMYPNFTHYHKFKNKEE